MPADPPPSARHLDAAGVREYLRAGHTARIRVNGDPVGFLVIDPAGRRLAVQVPVDGPLPNCAQYQNLAAVKVHQGGANWNQMAVTSDNDLEELYPLLTTVLDRVQLQSQTFAAAVQDVLGIYRAVLTRRSTLSESEEVGLYGELLVLRQLLDVLAPEIAVDTWLGAARAEHDFALPETDLEVKTTTAEQRRHWISSLTQLTPTPGRDLHLLSIQLTRTGVQGRSLPTLVQDVLVAAGPAAAKVMEELKPQYQPADADLYPERWGLRTVPTLYRVDATFPALRADAASPPNETIWSRILEVRYQIDLTGISHTHLRLLDGLLEPTGSLTDHEIHRGQFRRSSESVSTCDATTDHQGNL